MKTYWTTIEKPAVEKALNEAKITGDARKTILRFERFKLTCINNVSRMSWENVTLDPAFQRASTELHKLNDNGYGVDAPKALYWEEWKAYCEVLKILPTADLGDHLC